ncbi:Alpha/Beta hydrolase protein [Calycina marina]|uniref:Alpha/Beta hydrolase protein n=1 Tax=Calycina marina TaxID=1763456 RepID=A0A9P7ZAK1_9HELO|nr:Alpha/Beta hydrolase protein [Calycina marina]
MACPDCFSGTTHVGNPTGSVETIHNIPTYVTKPDEGATPKGLIIYLSDAFGWDFVNNRILADHYAKRGQFLVYVPDFMNGHAAPLTALDLLHKIMAPGSWLTALVYKPLWTMRAMSIIIPFVYYNREAVAAPRVYNFFKALRTSAPPFPTDDFKIGAAGFCWGGKYAIDLCADRPSTRIERHSSQKTTGIQPLVDCGFTAHPSNVKMPVDIEAATLPLSIAVGDKDMAMKSPLIQQMKKILESKKSDIHQVVIMPGAKHGFAVRAEEGELQMSKAQEAEDQAISWFNKWFT